MSDFTWLNETAIDRGAFDYSSISHLQLRFALHDDEQPVCYFSRRKKIGFLGPADWSRVLF